MRIFTRLVFILSLLNSGCTLRGKPDPSKKPVSANEITDFSRLFADNCAGCHGADGKLGPAPPLNDPIFLSIVPDQVLRHIVAEGRPGTLMPAFAQEKGGTLTADQVRILADGLKPRWPPNEKPRTEPPPYFPLTGGDPRRGETAFARACAMCHGPRGEGPSPESRINDLVFLALISDQALRRFVITGRPDFGMPNFEGKRGEDANFKPLTGAEVDDLVAYMSSWRKAGSDKRQ